MDKSIGAEIKILQNFAESVKCKCLKNLEFLNFKGDIPSSYFANSTVLPS